MHIDTVTNANSLSSEAEVWTGLRYLVVGLCFVLNMLDGADLLIISFVAPVLSDEWGIRPESLGAIFSASLAGMAVGCLLVAPQSDKFGRRTLILTSLALVSIVMVASGFVTSVTQLVIARFLIGVGVGTIGVTMTAMATEFAPAKHSSFAAGLVQAGWPLGSIITAFLAATYIGEIGWRPFMIAIGMVSSGLLLVVALLLPESLSFLMRRRSQTSGKAIQRIASRLNISVTDDLISKVAENVERPGIASLLRDGRRSSTFLLWIAAGFGYFVLYFVISWIPKLASDAGLPLSQAIFAGATYNVGAFIGTVLMGYLAIRYRVRRVISTLFMLSIVALLVFGSLKLPVVPTLLVAALIGVTVQGGFNGFWALAAKIYPPEMRGTGIGWALGVGRIGAVLGPIVGGLLLGAGVSVAGVFAFYALAPLIAAILCMFIREPKIQKN